MFKKKLRSHFLTTLIWLVTISLLRWDWHWSLLAFWLGGLTGFLLLDLDHFIYALFLYPQEPVSLQIRHFLKEKRFKETFELIVQTDKERTKLSFHSALFQAVFFIFCFFVLTSTNSWFVKGLVMAMALHLLKEEFTCLLKNEDEFLRTWLFWQIKGQISLKNLKFFVVLMLLAFLGLNLFLI